MSIGVGSALVADVAFQTRDALGEGPLWDPQSQRLYWVDLLGKRLLRGDPSSGSTRIRPLPYAASRATLCDDGRLLISFLRSPAFGTFESEGFEVLSAVSADNVDKQRFNDGACDSKGRFWTASYDSKLEATTGRMVCVDGGQVSRKVDGGIRLPNGIRWSPDEKTMYFVDSWPGHVWAYAFDAGSGELGPRRLLVDYEGTGVKPDGCATDADGCLWIAEVNRGRVARYTPDGALDRVVEVPTSKPTSVSFGGSDNSTLFVTSRTDGLTADQRAAQPHAGAVFAVAVTTAGLPEHPFHVESAGATTDSAVRE